MTMIPVLAIWELDEGCFSTLRGVSPATATSPLSCNVFGSTYVLKSIACKGEPKKNDTSIGVKKVDNLSKVGGIRVLETRLRGQVKSDILGFNHERPSK